MSRENFLNRIKKALYPDHGAKDSSAENLVIDKDLEGLADRTVAIQENATANWEELFELLRTSSEKAGWKVYRCDSYKEASDYIASLALERNSNHIIISDQECTRNLGLEKVDLPDESEITVITSNEDPAFNRTRAIEADIGVTGVDYAIAETGTCVVSASSEVGRLVSLAPPLYVAVVKKGQVLPSLDELFTMQRKNFLDDNQDSYTSLISGPSRSADIEYTLVTGVHGPGEVHLLLVEED